MRVIFNVPPEWVRLIDEIVSANGNSRASWVRDAVREKLERLPGSTLAGPPWTYASEVDSDQPA